MNFFYNTVIVRKKVFKIKRSFNIFSVKFCFIFFIILFTQYLENQKNTENYFIYNPHIINNPILHSYKEYKNKNFF